VSISTGPTLTEQLFSFATWEQIREQTGSFNGALAWAGLSRLTLAGDREPETVDALWISGGSFAMLGVRALLGRTLAPADDVRGGGSDGPVAVVSYRFWRQRLGGDEAIIGKRLIVERVPISVIGVVPPEFFGFEVGRNFDLALPIYTQPLLRGEGGLTRDQPWLRIVLRTK